MRLLVTGAGGFVGAAVARAAAADGHEVVGTIRPGGREGRAVPGVRLVAVDLQDRDGVTVAVADGRPEVIVHCAWRGVVGAARTARAQASDNIEASCHLLDAGIAAGVGKFVGIGSQGEYGPLSGRIDETHVPAPDSMYGAAKLAVLHLTRQIAAQAGIGFAWLRLFAAYGPGDDPRFLIPSLARQMLAGERPRTTEGIQRWDYLYIDDAARAIVAAATVADAVGVFNLGSGRSVPVREIVEMIRDRAAPGMALVFGEIAYGPHQVWHLEADPGRLCRATEWAPAVPLEAGLDRTVAALRDG